MVVDSSLEVVSCREEIPENWDPAKLPKEIFLHRYEERKRLVRSHTCCIISIISAFLILSCSQSFGVSVVKVFVIWFLWVEEGGTPYHNLRYPCLSLMHFLQLCVA